MTPVFAADRESLEGSVFDYQPASSGFVIS
jgi:hypothetical protein